MQKAHDGADLLHSPAVCILNSAALRRGRTPTFPCFLPDTKGVVDKPIEKMPDYSHLDLESAAMSSTKDESGVALPRGINREASHKNNPADFARRLAGHAGFDALEHSTIRRHETPPPTYMTPPPRYSRLEQPRLTVVIPSAAAEHRDAASTPTDAGALPPAVVQSTGSSPIESNEQRPSNLSISSRIRTKFRRKSTGIRERIRRSDPSSEASSNATSPCEENSSAVFELDSTEPTVLHHHAMTTIQELDSHPITSSERQSSLITSRWASCVPDVGASNTSSPRNHHGRRPSASSIVPTPRRGLSVPAQGRGRVSTIDASDLSGRLQALHDGQANSQPEVVISPCSPADPSHDALWQQMQLSRSNAVTDNVASRLDVISPISPVMYGPPVTPTLDGRLDRLPRLTTPDSASTTTTLLPHSGASIDGVDTGKELVSSLSHVWGRFDQPVSLPHFNQSQQITSGPRAFSSQAPEVFWSQSWSSPDQHQALIGHTKSAVAQTVSASQSLLGIALNSAISAISTLRTNPGPESPVSLNHARVRWRCVSSPLLR